MIIKYKKSFSLVYILITAYVLAGCSGLTQSDKPVTTTWWLEPRISAAPAVPVEPVIPLGLTVTAVPGLDTDEILTLSDAGALKPFAGARWADHLPELTASLIGRSLESSGRYDVSTGRAGRAGRGCDLQLELREFFAHLDPRGQTTAARVAIHARLQCESAEPLIFESSRSEAVSGVRMSDIVAAFQRAVDHVIENIIDKIQ